MADMSEFRTYRFQNGARTAEFFLEPDPKNLGWDMEQPYQRGEVWGLRRQRNWIKSMLNGTPLPSIIINDRLSGCFSHPDYSQERNWARAVVDGKQRVTAIRAFFNDEFAIPADWLPDHVREDVAGTEIRFGELPPLGRNMFRNLSIPYAEGQFATLEEERELFDLINFGGLAQGETDDD